MNSLIYVTLLLLVSIEAHSQDTLKSNQYFNCEIFKEKKGYDESNRLQFIKDNIGKRVTIYSVKGKKNIVKRRFEGIITFMEDS
jgi:hypothetical protein